MVEHPPGTPAQDTPVVPLRILLAEDDQVCQEVALLILRTLGHRVDAVTNGLEAVDAVKRESYDLVLMDVQMPELDGLAATRRIRAELPAERRPTIVGVTASSRVERHEACTAAGMDTSIAKPLRLQTLRAVLASLAGLAERDSGPFPPNAASGSTPAGEGSPGARESAVRTRLSELSGPDAGDDGLLADLLRSFVSRTPHLLDQLDRAAAERSTEQVEQLAHTLKGCAQNVGGVELARQLELIETGARGGALPHERVLRQVRQEQRTLGPILTAIAGQTPA